MTITCRAYYNYTWIIIKHSPNVSTNWSWSDRKNVHHYANYCWSQTNKSTK